MLSRSTILGFSALILLIFTVAVPLNAFFSVFPSMTYDIHKAQAEIGKAEATNDLRLVAAYMQNALGNVDHFAGNPGWWYPTVETDWGRIKDAVRSIISQAGSMNEPETSYAYQQMVHNLGDHQLPELHSQLDSIESIMTAGALSSVLWLIAIVISWIALFVLYLFS